MHEAGQGLELAAFDLPAMLGGLPLSAAAPPAGKGNTQEQANFQEAGRPGKFVVVTTRMRGA